MTSDHPLDRIANQLITQGARLFAEQRNCSEIWELSLDDDRDVVGEFPQCRSGIEIPDFSDKTRLLPVDVADARQYDACGFPDYSRGVPSLRLQPYSKWTDAMKSDLAMDGILLSETAWSLFQQHNLGIFRVYPARICDKSGNEKQYQFAFLRNELSPYVVDFARSEFFISDILGLPGEQIIVSSFEEWLELDNKMNQRGSLEYGSSINYKKLFFQRADAPGYDIFSFKKLSCTLYITEKLKNAIELFRISGLKINPNQRVYLSDPDATSD